MRKEQGITLIALVITIIVLLILAGVTLSTLFGNNGILTESKRAVEANKEANAKEQVQLAWTACETEYQAAWTKDSSVEKNTFFDADDLNHNLGIGEVTDVTFNSAGKSTVTYTAEDGTEYEFEIENGQVYKVGEGPAVTEPTETELTDITLSQDTMNLQVGDKQTLTATKVPVDADDTLVFTSEQPTIATVNATTGEVEGKSAGTTKITVKGTKKPDVAKQCTVMVENPTVAAEYLVDKVEIGDYVDIGITYTNQGTFYPSYTVGNTSYPSTGMTGWRVLSTSGRGENGTVTLVAAGRPLTFYHPSNQASTSIPMLEDLKKEITIVGSSTQGFTQNGFSSNNLKSIFESCSYIDTTKSIHAFGCSTNYTDGTGTKTTAYSPLDEIETAYEALTGSRKTIKELYDMSYPLKTENMKSANPSMSTKAYDLLGNGFTYWLGGASYSARLLWCVYGNGGVYNLNNGTGGVRPVVSLKSGVKVAESNSGDGSSESAAIDVSL